MLRRLTLISLNNGGFRMNKEKYERTELDVFEFQTEDVIMTSGIEYEDDEIPLMQTK